MRRGHTLIELLLVLTLLGASTASLAPTARRYLDRSAVVAAREALIGVFAEARMSAMESGGARVTLSRDPSVVSVTVLETTVRALDVGGDYGVLLELGGAGERTELAYDALGLGRMAAQTVVLRRGEASTELVVSGYGRVRRR